MTKELRRQKKTALALAIAQGQSVALWASVNHVPRSTAYRWTGQPEVRATAESRRRRARECALRRMATRVYRASYQVATLAECAESESVRLRALRSIVSRASAMSIPSIRLRRIAKRHNVEDPPVADSPPPVGGETSEEKVERRRPRAVPARRDSLHRSPLTAHRSPLTTHHSPVWPRSPVDIRSKNPKKAPFCLIFSRAQDAFRVSERAPHPVSPS
jgi:hypothetical protein